MLFIFFTNKNFIYDNHKHYTQLRIVTWQRELKALFSCSPLFLTAIGLTGGGLDSCSSQFLRLVPGSNPGSSVWYPRLYD
ncbi:hypothetical protein ACRRTK_012100 [Alexandromys fortis]